MTTLFTAITPPPSAHEHGLRLVAQFAASRADLHDLGFSDYAARKILAEQTPRALAPDEALEVPPAATATDLVTLVPSGPLARRFWNVGAYLRDMCLKGQVRLATKYLATDNAGLIENVYPIVRRYRIGSADALKTIPGPVAQAAAATEGCRASWPGQAWYYELGPARRLGLSLGYNLNGNGGVGALAGVQHHYLASLEHLVSTGGVLKGKRSD